MHFRQRFSYDSDEAGGFLHNRFNESIQIHHELRRSLHELVTSEQVDALIIEPEDGFSLLGGSRSYLSEELGLQERQLARWVLDGMNPDFKPNISSLADWMRSTDPDVTILGIPSTKPGSLLKGLVLVPYEGSKCYQRFAQARYNKPYRDFFYNVTYEGLYYAYHVLGARSFAISHLSAMKYGRDGYRMDITYSQVNAVLHFCDSHQGIKAVTYWDFERGNHPCSATAYLLAKERGGQHREISRSHEKRFGLDFISLDWPLPANHISNTATSATDPKRTGNTDVPNPLDTYKRHPGTS